jgi:hypothetical protein
MVRSSYALAAVTLALAARAAVPTPVVETGFLTPSGNIACNAGPYRGRSVLACTVFSAASPTRGQKIWAMHVYGRVVVGFLRSNAATDLPRLRYGHTWRWHAIRCRSERRALTCTNRSRHGYVLSRGRQRVF